MFVLSKNTAGERGAKEGVIWDDRENLCLRFRDFVFDTFLKDLFHFRIQQQQWRQDVDSRRQGWFTYGKEHLLLFLSSRFEFLGLPQ